MSDLFQLISWVFVGIVCFTVYFKLRKIRKESDK